jgi:undecaprenyl-phosphate 4-deoxy-4-formamido-L-arabinose transferase
MRSSANPTDPARLAPAAAVDGAPDAGPAPRSLSVVVPVFNSATILPRLVERLEPVLRANATAFEVLLVNDGSRDQSWQVVAELCRTRPWVRGIELMRNYGQHNALLCGIRAARYATVVTIDDDLQHPPEAIPLLLAELERGHDVVYGAPRKERHGLLRDLASQVTKVALAQAMGAPIARRVSAFRAFRTPLRDAFAGYDGYYVSIDVLLTWGTTRFTAIPVEHAPRQDGVSNYTVRKLVTHAMNMMTGFSTFPLQIASLVGFGFTLFGLAVLAYVIGRYVLQGSSVPGFPFLASVIAIFSGAQLFALGIIGEYLARVHFRTMNRPPYAVREVTEPAPEAAATGGSTGSPRA